MSELVLQHVSIETVHPNEWNPNRQSEAVREAEAESISRFGFIDPVTVRAHPERIGEWEVIDGEHRLEEAKRQGLSTIPIVAVEVSDEQARKLTVILNETRGEADVVELGKLLAFLQDGMSVEELLEGLPFSESELEHLLSLAGEDWDRFEGSLPGEQDGTGSPPAHDELVERLLALADQIEGALADDEGALAWATELRAIAGELA